MVELWCAELGMIIPYQNFNVIAMEGKIRITEISVEPVNTDGCVRHDFLVDCHACSVICQIFLQIAIVHWKVVV